MAKNEEKKQDGKQDKKPFTAGELIEYLQQFEKDRPLNMTIVTRRGKQIFGYPVKKFTLFTDVPDPHILVEVDQAVKVERPAERIKRNKREAATRQQADDPKYKAEQEATKK